MKDVYDPHQIFEDEKKLLSSQNNQNFKCVWKDVELNFQSKLPYKEERLALLGQVYDDLIFKKQQYTLNYQPFKNIVEVLRAQVNDEELHKQSLLSGCLTLKCQKMNDNHYLWPITEQIYKGTKYFYDENQEKQFHANNQDNISYFGSLDVAYRYAERYYGGIQVYKPVRPLKLFNILNDHNLQLLINIITRIDNESNHNAKFKVDASGTQMTKSELIKKIQVKYGVGINKYIQAEEISKYNKWDDGVQWLYKPLCDRTSYKNNNDASYTGWYYGAGQLDRVCAFGIMQLILDDGFDGLISQTGFYSPFLFQTVTGCEIILWNSHKLLVRNTSDQYDSEFLIKNKILSFDPKLINFNEKFASKNYMHQMIKFIQQNSVFKELDLSSVQQKAMKLMTLNVHNFESLIKNVSESETAKHLITFIKHYDIDVCCFEEYYDDGIDLSIQGYNIIKNKNHTGLVILYKQSVNLQFETSIKLENHAKRDQRRFALYFVLNNKLRLCLTHLEVGQKIKARSGSNMPPKQIKFILQKNSDLRVKQLKQIISFKKTDIILGDLNFMPQDKEYQFLIQSGYHTQNLEYTTPYFIQVDYIFYKDPKLILNLQTLSYQYSDHIPVVAILGETYMQSYPDIVGQLPSKSRQIHQYEDVQINQRGNEFQNSQYQERNQRFNQIEFQQQKKQPRQSWRKSRSRSRSKPLKEKEEIDCSLDDLISQRQKNQDYKNQRYNNNFNKY